MGQNNSSSSTTIKKEIENEITTSIKNTTENITRIVNETTNNISTSMTKSAAADIKIHTSASNLLNVDNIVAKSSDVDIEQTAEVQAENIAIIKIVQSTDAMLEMANKISAGVNNAVKNDSAAAESMKQAAALAQATKNAGGPEALVKSIMGTVDKMVASLNVGGSTSDNYINETKIKTKIKTDIYNTTINENNITNAVTTNIKTAMSMAAEAKCNMNTSAGNEIDIGDILATIQDGERAKVNIKQTVSLKAFNKCFIDLNMGSKIVNAIVGESGNFIKSDTSNVNKVSSEAKQNGSIKETTVIDSGISDMGKKLIGAVDSIGNNAIKTTGSVLNNTPDPVVNNTSGAVVNNKSGAVVNKTVSSGNDVIIIIIGVGIAIAIAIAVYFYSQTGNYNQDDMGPRSDTIGLSDGNGPSDDLGPDGLPIRGTQVGGLFSLEESEIYGMTEALIGGGKDPYGNIYLWTIIAVLVYYVYGKNLKVGSIAVIVIIVYIIYLSKEQTKIF